MHSSVYTLADQARMSRAKNYFAWQSRLVEPELGRRVVEVGCGIGNFTETLLDRELVVALDMEPGCVARLKQRYPDRRNLHAFTCNAASPEFLDLARFRADTCVCLNVLEHIGDDRQMIRAMASILSARGAIVLIVPAFQSLYGPIDQNLGHFRRYSRRSVAKLAAEAGFRIRKAHYLNATGFFGWWANSHIFKRQAQSEHQIEVFDRYLVPVISRLEGLVPPPFGQSLFVVLEKS